ncbi:MAG: hypothetical protein JSR91_09055 [Proteobacteria bacterium]|nr:hypothetical protein [Pseudomonadota bacterium]
MERGEPHAVAAVGGRLTQLGIEKVDDSTPESTATFIKAEIWKWRALVELAGAKID